MYSGNPREAADQVVGLEKAGLDTVWVAEAYGFDSPTLMGYLAAKTETIEIGAGILNVFSRTPSALLQTAAGLDNVSGGRAVIGLGASGPQVIEGFHGLPYDRPLGRTREVIQILRQGLRRERLEHQGKIFTLPLPADQGLGLGKPLKILTKVERNERPDLGRRARRQQRRDDRRGRRRLAALPLPAREGQGRLGRRARQGHRQALRRPGAARDLRRRHGRDRRGRGHQEAARLHAPDVRAVRRRHGRPRQELLQRARLPLRVREGGQADPGPLPRRQQARRRGARARPSGSRPATWSARRRTSRSGSPPSARPASPTCRSPPCRTTRWPPLRRSRSGSADEHDASVHLRAGARGLPRLRAHLPGEGGRPLPRPVGEGRPGQPRGVDQGRRGRACSASTSTRSTAAPGSRTSATTRSWPRRWPGSARAAPASRCTATSSSPTSPRSGPTSRSSAGCPAWSAASSSPRSR